MLIKKQVCSQNIYQHSKFWVIYLIYFYLLNLLGNKEMSLLLAICSLPYFMMIFYTIFGILRRYFRKKRFFVGSLLIFLFYSISAALIYVFTYHEHFKLLYGAYVVSNYSFDILEFIQTLLIMHGHFTILAILYNEYELKVQALSNKVSEMEKRLFAEKQRDKFEFISLAEHVPAHTMANVFEYWKTHFRSKEPKLTNQLEKMYELMQYFMNAHDSQSPKRVICRVEVNIVRSYIELQRSLTTDPIEVVWDIKGDIDSNGIPPTTLMTLLENALKHGISDDSNSPIIICFKVLEDSIIVSVENKKKLVRAISGNGLGLSALKRRLEYVYGSKCRIDIEDLKYNFKTIIKILT